MTRSLVRTLLASGAAAALLAGCAGSGLGAAARLGGERISHDAVAELTDRGYVGGVTRRAERSDLQRLWLTQLVKAELYREAARRLGALPSDAELAKLVEEDIRARGGQQAVEERFTSGGIAVADIRGVIETNLFFELIGDAVVRDVQRPESELREAYRKRLIEFDQAHIAHIKVKDKATADRLLAQIRAGADFAKLATQSIDVATAPTGGDLGVIGNGPGKYAPQIVAAVFSAKTGAVLGPIRVPDGFHIVRVIERVTLPFEEARDLVRRGLVGEERDKRRAEYLNGLLRELGLSVNPRYGRWDEEDNGVVAGEDGLSSPAATPGVQQPAGPVGQ